jgi:hypothetical protein
MSILYPGRVYQTSTTTGTGTLTLSGSSSAALTWQSKFGAGPLPVLYLIQGASYFEMGRGVFTSPSTLTRVDVYSSSNSDALVVLPAATHDVFAWLPGEARYTVSFSATKTLAISEWATIQQFTGSSAATVNLPAKANMPGGFHCTVHNDGTAPLTIDPSGAETVEGGATLVVYPGQFGELSYDGTTWRFKSHVRLALANDNNHQYVASGVTHSFNVSSSGGASHYLVSGMFQGNYANSNGTPVVGIITIAVKDGATVLDSHALICNLPTGFSALVPIPFSFIVPRAAAGAFTVTATDTELDGASHAWSASHLSARSAALFR